MHSDKQESRFREKRIHYCNTRNSNKVRRFIPITQYVSKVKFVIFSAGKKNTVYFDGGKGYREVRDPRVKDIVLKETWLHQTEEGRIFRLEQEAKVKVDE